MVTLDMPSFRLGRVERMKREVLAYLAGVIDSDGTIGVKRSTYHMRVRKDAEQATYSERICVRQVEPHAVDLLHATFAGSRYMTKPSVKRGKPLHTWAVTDLRAAAALRALLPFLRIKSRQAENCLALRALKTTSRKARSARGRGHVGAAARPAHLGVAMEACHARAHELNRVGV
jgi:hypothetical protein